MAKLLNETVLKDDELLPPEEREARKVGRGATYAGAATRTVGGIAAVSASGAVSGLSAAGITSGLAAVGGGSMAIGTAVVVAAPVAAAAIVGLGVYAGYKGYRR